MLGQICCFFCKSSWYEKGVPDTECDIWFVDIALSYIFLVQYQKQQVAW